MKQRFLRGMLRIKAALFFFFLFANCFGIQTDERIKSICMLQLLRVAYSITPHGRAHYSIGSQVDDVCYRQEMTRFNQSPSVLRCLSSSCNVSWSRSSNAPLICLSFSLGWILRPKAALSIPLTTLTSASTMNNTLRARHDISRCQIVSSPFDNVTKNLRIQFLILMTVQLKLGF